MSEQDANTDPWLLGSQYAQLFGSAPSSFTTLIRGLMKDEKENNNSISFHHASAMVRFLRGDSMRAPFYFALKTYKKDLLQGEPIPAKTVALAFEPVELAACLGMLYSFRRIRGLVNDESEWNFIRELALTRSEVGAFIGKAIPNVGPGLGLIAGGIRFLALGAFLLHDKKGYVEYRRHLKKNDLLADLEFEMNRWGCTHGHIAAHLLIALGFNSEVAIPMGRGFIANELPQEAKGQYEYAVKLVEIWTDTLLEQGKQPEMKHSGNFYPLEENLEVLIAEVAATKAEGSQFYWVEKQKSDLNPEVAPEFFDAAGGSPSSSSDDEDVAEDASNQSA